jgi:hypothetical protein
MYHWGSNSVRAAVSGITYDMVNYNLDVANHANYKKHAEEIIHYFHGVNPFNHVYLSNMSKYGAEKSVSEIYHYWFADGSDWDNVTSAKGRPVLGFFPGGPNQDYKYEDKEGYCPLVPPCNQPRQKAYRDWNTNWPDAAYAITEPGIYYNSSYVKALSCFVTTANSSDAAYVGTSTTTRYEAENATLTGTYVTNAFSGASGTSVDGLDAAGDKIIFSVNANLG